MPASQFEYPLSQHLSELKAVRNWTKLFAQMLFAITLIVLAAIASRAVYIRLAPPPSTEVRDDGDFNRDVADCGAQRRPADYQTRKSQLEDNAIRMASCLDS
ncbi:hypothetical protein [Cupriavidus pauculus]|uniref:hypothetical protein n=1 Tax=Cupriavidus pauculus TaxID=82633 RepID=UPI001EE1EBBC|nr:hypothetical protein [Cupriavidus pauculus]GJG96681.1 hypothetical protein CBA19C6_19350 [Cupriavidus pauculus]